VSIFQTPHTCIHTSPVLILKLPSPYGKSQASGAGDEADSAACVVDEGWVLAGDAIEEAPELAGLVELALLRASPSRLRLAAHSRLRVQLPPRPAASALPRAAASTPSCLHAQPPLPCRAPRPVASALQHAHPLTRGSQPPLLRVRALTCLWSDSVWWRDKKGGAL
jgi:hypothetical protein